MMKLLVFTTFFLSSVAFASTYECLGGSFDPVTVEVIDNDSLLINGKNRGDVDWDYASKNPEKKSYRLIGSFDTLGDGADGFSVDVSVTKYFFNNSKVAYLDTYNRGPEGYYSDSYKCQKID
ncbi:hypothetical protein K2X05_07500 [bacterium]|nr:hypothetical protein [bacterium]